MQIIVYILFLSVSFFVFFAYRQGIKDSFYITKNIPLEKTKNEKESKKENGFIEEYEKMMNYSFDMAGEANGTD